MVRALNLIVNTASDALMAPFRAASPWPAMLAASLVASVIILLIFKYASNQEKIRRNRNRLVARVLELLVFKHDFALNILSFGRACRASGAYIAATLPALIAMIVPLGLLLVQWACWFDARPLRPTETAIVSVRLDPSTPVMDAAPRATASANLRIDSEALRIPNANEVDWRVQAVADGPGWVDIEVAGQRTRKEIAVDRRLAKVSVRRVQRDAWRNFVNPVEPSIADTAGIHEIAVNYPPRQLRLGGRSIHWLVAFFVLTLVLALALHKPLRVEI